MYRVQSASRGRAEEYSPRDGSRTVSELNTVSYGYLPRLCPKEMRLAGLLSNWRVFGRIPGVAHAQAAS